MQLPISIARTLAAMAALAPIAAHAQQTFTPKGIVQWGQGGERERGMLTQMGFAQLAQGQFGLSVADLNADGRPEILVLSMSACDNAGCVITALQSGGGTNVRQIFSQKVGGRLAITNETVNGYNAFAAADPAGAIMKDGAGRLIVYPVGGTAQAAAAPVANARPAAAASPPAASAAPVATAAPAAAAPARRPGIPPERLKIVTGEGQPDWRTPGAEYLPVCTFPICMNPQIAEKTGIGTEKATARGDVTVEDATRWCALYKALYTLCVDEQVSNNGSRGGMYGRRFVAAAEANCMAGTMKAIDGGSYTYVGTWPDGPGAGRARFSGTAGRTAAGFEQLGAQQMNSGQQSLAEVALSPNSGESLAIQWEILCKGAPAPVR